jgi:hypothetical protein
MADKPHLGSPDAMVFVLSSLDCEGLISDSVRAALRTVYPATGRLIAEELLVSAEQYASRGTAKGKRIAKYLPRLRVFIEEIKQGSR